MRTKVNHSCNICTGDHSNAYCSPGREPRPEITVPSLRLRLSIEDAEQLAQHLAEAVAMAKKLESI